MTFPSVNAPLRNDVSFDEMRDEYHHHASSPLNELGVGCVSSFPLDYMHLVCLGVVRKLISRWINGRLPYRLPNTKISAISDRLVSMRKRLPREFARKPRSLLEFCRW